MGDIMNSQRNEIMYSGKSENFLPTCGTLQGSHIYTWKPVIYHIR